MTTRINQTSFRAEIYSPYELRDIVKSFPAWTRHWDPVRKCWQVELGYVDAIAGALRAAGEDVYFTGGGDEAKRPASPSTPSPNWAVSLLAAVGPAREEAAYRAMSKVVHPDAGGSTELMQQLNAARNQVGGR